MKRIVACVTAILLLCGVFAAYAEPADMGCLNDAGRGVYVEGLSEEGFAALTETTVIRDESSPTGYYVTFRYSAPDATRVRIRGEWSFATDRGVSIP